MRTMNEVRAIPVFDEIDEAGERLLQDIQPFDASSGVRAVNDAPYDAPTFDVDIDAWPRHAARANGFGDADEPSRSAIYHIHHGARANRAAFLVGLAAKMFRRMRETLRRLAMDVARHQEATDTRVALETLDDRTLRDLGFHRSEIGSIAAEATGHAERTRARFVVSAADAMGARSFQ